MGIKGNVWLSLFRAWLVAAVCWMAYWAWHFYVTCWEFAEGFGHWRLFCPAGNINYGNSTVTAWADAPANEVMRRAAVMFGVPLLLMALGAAIWWVIRPVSTARRPG
jgi:hypothetical protein